jgi:hypothetical protein
MPIYLTDHDESDAGSGVRCIRLSELEGLGKTFYYATRIIKALAKRPPVIVPP